MSNINGSENFIRNVDKLIDKRKATAPKKERGLKGLLQRTSSSKSDEGDSTYDTAYMVADIVANMRKGNNDAS